MKYHLSTVFVVVVVFSGGCNDSAFVESVSIDGPHLWGHRSESAAESGSTDQDCGVLARIPGEIQLLRADLDSLHRQIKESETQVRRDAAEPFDVALNDDRSVTISLWINIGSPQQTETHDSKPGMEQLRRIIPNESLRPALPRCGCRSGHSFRLRQLRRAP